MTNVTLLLFIWNKGKHNLCFFYKALSDVRTSNTATEKAKRDLKGWR